MHDLFEERHRRPERIYRPFDTGPPDVAVVQTVDGRLDDDRSAFVHLDV